MKRALVALISLLGISCATFWIASTPREAARAPGFREPALDGNAFVTADGARLPATVWRPDAERAPRAVIISIHGMNMHGGIFDELGDYFAARGVIVYSYDQRGFGDAPRRGDWVGAPTLTADLADVIASARAQDPDTPIFLFGARLGGGVFSLRPEMTRCRAWTA